MDLLLLIPIIGAIFFAVNITLSKYVVSNEHVPYKDYCVYLFVFMFVIMLPFSPFFSKLPSTLDLTMIATFLGIVALGFVYNILFTHGMKYEKMNETDSIFMTGTLITIILAFIFYADERKLIFLIPAAIAGIALIWAHIKKHHLKFSKLQLLILLAVFMMAIENMLFKKLLFIVDAYTLYFYRVTAIAILYMVYKRPNLRHVKKRAFLHMFFLAATSIIAIIAFLWSIKTNGIIYTSLIYTFSPLLIMLYSFVGFKEKVRVKQIIAAAIIFLCVVAGEFIKAYY